MNTLGSNPGACQIGNLSNLSKGSQKERFCAVDFLLCM